MSRIFQTLLEVPQALSGTVSTGSVNVGGNFSMTADICNPAFAASFKGSRTAMLTAGVGVSLPTGETTISGGGSVRLVSSIA